MSTRRTRTPLATLLHPLVLLEEHPRPRPTGSAARRAVPMAAPVAVDVE